jgi:protein translocase SecG subunit
MLKFVNIAEIIVAVLLVVSVLLQNRGAGLSGAFGGDFGGYYTRRGLEKFLVMFSVVLSFLFIVLAISSLILSKSTV